MTIGPSQKATGEGVPLGCVVAVELGEGIWVGLLVELSVLGALGAAFCTSPTCTTFELGWNEARVTHAEINNVTDAMTLEKSIVARLCIPIGLIQLMLSPRPRSACSSGL